MKKNFLIVLLFMVLVSAHAQNKTAANQSVPSPYEPDILFSFANSLYDEGFLNQAEGEYKRFLFALPPDSLNSNLKVQTSLTALTNIYKKQNSVNGIEWLKKNFYSNAQTPVKEKINFVQADFIFKERNAGMVRQAFSSSRSSQLVLRLWLRQSLSPLPSPSSAVVTPLLLLRSSAMLTR